MSHITLIRHGQANAQANTEEEYDQLSDLGHQQARWLGAHLRDTHNHHTRLYTGTLRRHRETAQAMGTALDRIEDPRLNEMEYFTMAQALQAEHGTPIPDDPTGFVTHLPHLLEAWQQGRIESAPEPFDHFETRVTEALHDIGAGDGPALVVTSGGLIAMTMRLHLGLDVHGMARIALAIMNSSMHRLFPIGGTTWSPVLFNAVPHLERPDRHHAQTHV